MLSTPIQRALLSNSPPLGWRVHKKVTVGDDLTLLCQEIDKLCDDSDVLIVNGGLGPTVDDLTAAALSSVSQQPLCEHPQGMRELLAWCDKRGFTLNEANRKQAILPQGCNIISNARGSAPGILLEHKGCLVIATPGVPSELQQMLADEILPMLQQRFDSDHIQTLRLGVFGLGESSIQELFDRELPHWPEEIELGFRASMPVLEVKLTASGADAGEQLSPLAQTRGGSAWRPPTWRIAHQLV